jgi:hypothetical protein
MNPSPDIPWKISSDPATLTRDEFWARYEHPHTPEKFEVCEGKLFWHEDQRLGHCHSAFRIPHSAFERAVGLKKALSLCPPEAVRAALQSANPQSEI